MAYADKPQDESCHPCQNVVKFCNLSDHMFATGGDDCCVYVWRIVEPSSSSTDEAKWKHELVHKLSGHMKEIKDLAFDPTDTLLASASLDQGCRLFEVETGKLGKFFGICLRSCDEFHANSATSSC